MKLFTTILTFSFLLLLIAGLKFYFDHPMVILNSTQKLKNQQVQRFPASEERGGDCGETASHFLGSIPLIKNIYSGVKKITNWGTLQLPEIENNILKYTTLMHGQNNEEDFAKAWPLPKNAEEYIAYIEVLNRYHLAQDGVIKFNRNGEPLPAVPRLTSSGVRGRYRSWKVKRAVKYLYGKSFAGKMKNLFKLNKKLTENDIQNMLVALFYYSYGDKTLSKDFKKAAARVMLEKFATKGIVNMALETEMFLDKPHFIYQYMSSQKGKNLMNWVVIAAFSARGLPPPFLPRIEALYRMNKKVKDIYAKALRVGWINLSEQDQLVVYEAWAPDLKTDIFIERVAPFFAVASMLYLGYAQAEFIIGQDEQFDTQKKTIDRLAEKLASIFQLADKLEKKGFQIFAPNGEVKKRDFHVCKSLIDDCVAAQVALLHPGKANIRRACKKWLDPHSRCLD